MSTLTERLPHVQPHPVDIRVVPVTENRNRLTTGFRMILGIPHVLLVGGPAAAVLTWTWGWSDGWGAGGGVLGAVAGVCALIAWFSIIATGRAPDGLWNLGAMYLRWRVRAVAYLALLRDEYPPFGEAEYPATIELSRPELPRDRLTVAFRPILAIPHLVCVWALGFAWLLTTIVAWFSILFTGRYPPELYSFGVSVLRWNVRVEAYLLLLRDEYPPFTLD